MALGGTGNGDGELVAELLTDELDQLGGVVKIAARALPAERQIAAQGEDVVDAVVQIGLELITDAFLGVADAGEVGHGDRLGVLLHVLQDLEVQTDVAAAGTVGAGDVIGIQGVQLFQNAAFTAELLHALLGLRGEDFK